MKLLHSLVLGIGQDRITCQINVSTYNIKSCRFFILTTIELYNYRYKVILTPPSPRHTPLPFILQNFGSFAPPQICNISVCKESCSDDYIRAI